MSDTFPSLFKLLRELNFLGPNGLPSHTPPQFEVIELGSRNEGRVAASPIPMSPLFRGQSCDFEICKPSLQRKVWSELELFEREMQLYDFTIIVNEHPEIRERLDAGIVVNYEALAQHYGIATNMLDLTNSPLVASFFATTYYDAMTDTYRPVLNRISRGVLYVSWMGGMLNISGKNQIWPVGFEALHRPGEQRAFEMTVNEGCDITSDNFIQKYTFWHNPQESMAIWNCTLAGSIFFPYDPMADKVKNIKKYKMYSHNALINAYSKFPNIASSISEIETTLKQNGYHFYDTQPFAYTKKEKEYLLAETKRLFPDFGK